MSDKNLKLSVIVLIFGTERFLTRCIDSIIQQSYKNIEVILVNDCSPDKCNEIIDEFAKKDARIKVVNTVKEMGPWNARLYGAEFATGDFLSFIDSDDYIGIDGYRLMIENAIKNNSDIVIANDVRDFEKSGNKVVQQYGLPSKKCFENEEIFNHLLKQDSTTFCYQVLWNKIFSKELWNRSKIDLFYDENYFMYGDDVLLTFILFYYAKKMSYVNYVLTYYYVGCAGLSSSESTTPKKIARINKDLPLFMKYTNDFLKNKGIYKKYADNIARQNYSTYCYCKFIIKDSNINEKDKKKYLNKIEDIFKNFKINNYYGESVGFFYTHYCLFEYSDELLRKSIVLSNYKYISFDIFGTLINKPFLKDDFFLIFDMEIEKKIRLPHKFSEIRKHCEEISKANLFSKRNSEECINIDMIYKEIENIYNIDKKVIMDIKKLEIELEIKYNIGCNNISEIFQLAKVCNKKIIIIADTIFMKTTIEDILAKNGYLHYFKLYLSSELKLSKSIGGLYDYAINDLKCNSWDILHIGDNSILDFENAKMKGIDAYTYHNKEELLFNVSKRKYTGDSTANMNYQTCLLTRLSLAIVGNKYFDNPYIHFSPPTDYNADPYFIGYYPVGMHMLSVVKWIIEELIKNNCSSICFNKANGSLSKNCYDIVSTIYNNAPQSSYEIGEAVFNIEDYSITYTENKHSFYYENLPKWDKYIINIIMCIPNHDNNIDEYIYSNINDGTLEFIQDIVNIHGDLIKKLDDEKHLSSAFEFFMIHGKERDKRIFKKGVL